MKKWPLWIGSTLLAVAALQLIMIFILPSLPMGVASESAQAANDRAANDEAATSPPLPDAAPLNTAALPLYTACVPDATKPPVRLAANIPDAYRPLSNFVAHAEDFFAIRNRQADARRIDILFVFSVNTGPGGDHIVVRAPAQRSVVMFRSFASHDPEAEENDGARQSSDCTPF